MVPAGCMSPMPDAEYWESEGSLFCRLSVFRSLNVVSDPGL